jgi:hypothetical protein
MNSQQLEYVRQQLIVATADLSGATKGQAGSFRRERAIHRDGAQPGRKKVFNKVTAHGQPTWSADERSQSRAKGSSIALVSPVEFGTASWRRAVLSLEDHQKAWLLWNYSENTRFEYQVAITQWAWAEFREQLGAKKVAGKTMERLKKLVWLAAQDVKAELAGRDVYQHQDLAALCVKPITGVITTLTTGGPCAPSLSGLMATLSLHCENTITTKSDFFAARYCKSQLNSHI